MSFKSSFLFLSILWLTANQAIAEELQGNAEAGADIYSSKGCIGCHGPGGNSPNPAMFPKTAGLDAAYLQQQLIAFRNGTRSNPMMSPMSTGLSDQEIADLAAYLAAQ